MVSTEDRTYNGWKNYETWVVGMYLDGNYTGEGTYRAVLELVEEQAQHGPGRLADVLKDFVAGSLPDLGASLAADLLGAAMSEVDWFELAGHKLDEVAEQS